MSWTTAKRSTAPFDNLYRARAALVVRVFVGGGERYILCAVMVGVGSVNR